MPTHVALLRGINVGGRNRVAMADLRQILTALGHTDVASYIQSGNVVFKSEGTGTGVLASALERAIAETLGVRPKVVVLSRAELAQVVTDNPYPEATDPKRLHAVFRAEGWGPADVAAVAEAVRRAGEKSSGDEAQVVGRALFLHTPDGLGRSELAAQLARRGGPLAPDGSGTARNWATVVRLLAMLDA